MRIADARVLKDMKHRSQCANSGAVPAVQRPVAAKLALSLVLCASCLPAITHASQPAKSISLSSYPKATNLVDQVVVPVPSEVFSVLDKLGKPAWAEVVRPQKGVASPSGGKEQISLLLGIVIADGFVAVEAENADEVKAIGNSVRTLAKTIGVEKAVSRRANSIAEFADKRRWVEVRRELDLALSDVRQAMEEGWTNDQLAAKLADNYAFSDERAMVISRTETIRASNEGALASYRAADVTEKEWTTAEDDRVSEDCEANGEQGPIGIDEAFDSGDDVPPAHPNCRCVVVPVVTFASEETTTLEEQEA